MDVYGFPLTIYSLSGWLGQKFPGVDLLNHDADHLLERLFGWDGAPHNGKGALRTLACMLGSGTLDMSRLC
ncbi:hypothetical protein SAMN05421875_1602 [Acidovorax soli]|uniref:Uncharacterized protein n=1 Tax=Acidovorax soli TaxID=592050 RepID=A0A1H4FFT4_9BURK|nr:hypothetical protein SAMN05421875_1602 [Acidovorax soli]